MTGSKDLHLGVFMKTMVILILLTHSLGIAAIPQEKQAGSSPCESSTGTQTEANACARHKYKQADSGMDQVYEQLMTELAGFGSDGKTQQKLRQAQSIWLQYRSANCESEASIYEGGSIRPAVYYSCLASMTEERTKRMRRFLAVTRQ